MRLEGTREVGKNIRLCASAAANRAGKLVCATDELAPEVHHVVVVAQRILRLLHQFTAIISLLLKSVFNTSLLLMS
jgi:hypothetical protein